MRADERRPIYKPPKRDEALPQTSLLECVLAILGALVMATFFIACIVAVGQ